MVYFLFFFSIKDREVKRSLEVTFLCRIRFV